MLDCRNFEAMPIQCQYMDQAYWQMSGYGRVYFENFTKGKISLLQNLNP